jgi:hemolysin activation/secretion protein
LRFSDLEQLRVELTRAYTDEGYINSGALLPDQQVADGVITYQIVEGSLDSIDISGNGRLRPDYVTGKGSVYRLTAQNYKRAFSCCWTIH